MSVPFSLVYLAIGLIVCYTAGTLWYTFIYSGGNILSAIGICVLPFIMPDIIKVSLALLVAKKVVPIIRKIR